MIVPTILLVGLAGIGVANQLRTTDDANVVSDNVELALATQDLIHSLQRERALSSGLLGRAGLYRTQLDGQRRATDQNRAALDRRLKTADGASARAVRAALGRLGALQTARLQIDSGQQTRAAMLNFYTAAIVGLSSASADSDIGQDDLVLRRGLESLHVLGDVKESIAKEGGQLNGVLAQNRFSRTDYIDFTATRAARIDSLARFAQVATPQRKAQVDAAERSPQATLAQQYEQAVVAGSPGRELNLSAPTWSAATNTVNYDLREIQRDIGDDVRIRAAKIRTGAVRTLVLYSAAAIIAVLTALLLWLYTFRSIVRPLRLLTDEAHEAAERRLPEAVARIQAAEEPGNVIVESSRTTLARREDEFAEVVEALDNLQQTAVQLAAQQAVMRHNTAESLANLGRRNQNLVRRQLGFISALERDEADPNALANLFELDHLATRMRRNAESLLVLVGEHSPRRWSTALDVGDVLRSAFAEVEDYRRVILRRMDDGKVRGAAAAEISHLLAELVENALSFSPPDREVEVQARSTGAEYHIAIVDQGVGMSPAAMATANARLRGEENFLVAPTRDLGHYVVGRLAQRLGVRVWLHDSPLVGVTARIVLPSSVLEHPEKIAQTAAAATVPPVRPPAVAALAQPSGTARHRDTLTQPASSPAVPMGTATAATASTSAPRMSAAATTRNGLVKRDRREGNLRRPIRPDQRVPAPAAADERKRTPDDVQSMLNTFRSGVHRAEQERDGETG
ncbi:MAG TPA: nitrate- and nitrite sensing domain-containing protein [Streptosporangiaceae bacterium]